MRDMDCYENICREDVAQLIFCWLPTFQSPLSSRPSRRHKRYRARSSWALKHVPRLFYNVSQWRHLFRLPFVEWRVPSIATPTVTKAHSPVRTDVIGRHQIDPDGFEWRVEWRNRQRFDGERSKLANVTRDDEARELRGEWEAKVQKQEEEWKEIYHAEKV